MKRLYCLLFALLLETVIAAAQQAASLKQVTIRVCTYNVLNYGANVPVERQIALKRVIDSVKADVLVLHEIEGAVGEQAIATQVLGDYARAAFSDGTDTDNALFYNATKLTPVSHDTVPTNLRLIDVWAFAINGTNDTLGVYGCNLKAGDDNTSKEERDDEAGRLQVHAAEYSQVVHADYYTVLAGDLNVYSSFDETYRYLSDVFQDPISDLVVWHLKGDAASVMTQSTRGRQFGGGIGGGMDDRFDFVMLDRWHYMNDNYYYYGKYTTFGNDGKHFNDSINRMPNTAVDSVTAQALHDASDHLPVYYDLLFTAVATSVEERRLAPTEMDLSKREDP